jgi:hypothetical protein
MMVALGAGALGFLIAYLFEFVSFKRVAGGKQLAHV